jgi:tRNA pseudouridine-54 N-methylase
VQAVSDSTLSEADGILALVIAERSGKSVAEVLKMRTDGLGWGRIMAQLEVSGRDIGETMSQAEATAVASSPGAASQGQGTSSKPAVSNEQQARGKVTVVSATVLHIDGFANDIILNADTKVEQVGAGTTNIAAIKFGQTVQVHVLLSGTTYTAQQVHIEDKYVKLGTPSDEDGNQPATPSNEHTAVSNEQQARGKVIAVTAATLRIDGYAHDIVLTTSSKVEQVGAGKSTVADIKVGQTVQVHVLLSGTTYTAQQVHIEDKYVKPDKEANEQATDPALKTWQGTISGIFVQPGVNSASEQTIGVVVLTASGQQPTLYWILPTSVLQDAGHHTLTLAALQTLQGTAAQKVTIQGRLLADGTVNVVKIVLTTDTGENPGKGNGKH